MGWFIHSLKNYANFSGRANRREWWIFWFFFCVPAVIVAVALPNMADGSTEAMREIADKAAIPALSAVLLWNVFLVVPYFAVTVRRNHDIGLSAWWLLLVLVPIVGAVFFLIVILKSGEREENSYGNPPPVHPSLPSKAPESFGSIVSNELEHEQKTSDLLRQLRERFTGTQSADALDSREKSTLIRFYSHWYPKQRVDSRMRELQKSYGKLATWSFCVAGALLLSNEGCQKFFGFTFLNRDFVAALGLIGLSGLAFIALTSVYLPHLSSDSLSKYVFSFYERKAKSKMKFQYADQKDTRSASNFFENEIYPALGMAFAAADTESSDQEARRECLRMAASQTIKELDRLSA